MNVLFFSCEIENKLVVADQFSVGKLAKATGISLLITDLSSHVTIVRRYFRLCDDPKATANSGGSRPLDNGGGGAIIQTLRCGGQQSPKKIF